MKSSKILVLGILLYGTFLSQAQEVTNSYPDTLKMTTDSQTDVIFSFYRMSDKEVYLTDDLWKSILNVMEAAVESSESKNGIIVTYKKVKRNGEEVAQVIVDPLKSKADIYLIGNEGMVEILANRIDFEIYQSKVSIAFSLNNMADLEEIKELSVESVWNQIENKFENEGKRNLYTGTGAFKYGNANILKTNGAPAQLDGLEISAGIGFGFYRDRFAPDLNFRLAVNWPDRLGNDDLKFGFIYSQQYFYQEQPEGDFNLDVNDFLSAFVSSKIGSDREIGIALGMLVRRNGDFYEGNTFKVTGFNRSTKSRVNFSPELIFTDDFKKMIPALKFGLSF
ncbi:hypothetical protein [Ekhidna sp. To15]|uniref:hypothetical protein n=1 Tax=Ekhidna sp. To15 TaxID=3395267 RepID=UPI003F527FAB